MALLALVVGLVCAACALAAGPGYQMQVLSLGTGLQTIRWAATGAAVGAAVAVCSLVMLVVARGRQGRALAIRTGARNAVDYSPQTAIEQHRGYPDIVPLKLGTSPADAFDRVVGAVRSMGWDVVSAVPSDLRVEATDTTLLFGFKDDVVVRVRPTDEGSVIDVRSLSRVGGSDFGVNARRVRALLRKISEGMPS